MFAKWIAKCPRCPRSYGYQTYRCARCGGALLLDPNRERGPRFKFARLVCSTGCGNAQDGLKCRCGGWITCAGLRWVQPVSLKALKAIFAALVTLTVLAAIFTMLPSLFAHARAWVVAH